MTIREAIYKSAQQEITLSEFIRHYLRVRINTNKFEHIKYEQIKDELHPFNKVTYEDVKDEIPIVCEGFVPEINNIDYCKICKKHFDYHVKV